MLVIFAPVMPQLTCQMPVQLCNFAMLTGLGVKQQLSSPKQTIAQCSTEEILQILGAWKDLKSKEKINCRMPISVN